MIAKKIIVKVTSGQDRDSWNFDFNALIPRPSSLDMNCGSETEMADVIYQVWMNFPKNLVKMILKAKDPDELFLANSEGGLTREVCIINELLDKNKAAISDYQGVLKKLNQNAHIAQLRMRMGSIWTPNSYNGIDFFDGIKSYAVDRLKQQAKEQNLTFPSGLFLFLTKAENMKLFDLGKVRQTNREKYGHPDWYEWSIDKWGTKWNASETRIGFDEGTISFSTAWSAPFPIFYALSCAIPHSRIDWIYADEDRGCNCGHFVCTNGIVDLIENPANGSPEAFAIYVECWGADDCMHQNDDGNWKIHSCKDCPNPCQ